MPSPFPGMDPYLERSWRDVHTTLVAESRRALNRQLPKGLYARIEERVGIEVGTDDDPGDHIGPDVRVIDRARPPTPRGSGAAVIDAPFRLVPGHVQVIERYVRILDEDGRLISVVEFVSPSNKRGRRLVRFRRNRVDLLASGVHFVEVDLVRAGNWRRLMSPDRCPERAASTYRATVRTAGDGGGGYLYPIGLRQPLPDVPVPLRSDEPPATLPLQAMLQATYDDGRYHESVDYTRPPRPPLDPDDAAWAAELFAGRAR